MDEDHLNAHKLPSDVSNRIGRLVIDGAYYYGENRDILYSIFTEARIVPLAIQQHPWGNWNNRVVFIAMCEQFEVIEKGAELPDYVILCENGEDGNVTVTVKREDQ